LDTFKNFLNPSPLIPGPLTSPLLEADSLLFCPESVSRIPSYRYRCVQLLRASSSILASLLTHLSILLVEGPFGGPCEYALAVVSLMDWNTHRILLFLFLRGIAFFPLLFIVPPAGQLRFSPGCHPFVICFLPAQALMSCLLHSRNIPYCAPVLCSY